MTSKQEDSEGAALLFLGKFNDDCRQIFFINPVHFLKTGWGGHIYFDQIIADHINADEIETQSLEMWPQGIDNFMISWRNFGWRRMPATQLTTWSGCRWPAR